MAKKTKKKVAGRKTGTKRKQTTAKKTSKSVTKRTAAKKTSKSVAKRTAAKKTSKPVTKRTAVKKAVKKISKSPAKQPDNVKPGMMGDGTEEQNLNQRGNPDARITKDEVDAAFKKPD